MVTTSIVAGIDSSDGSGRALALAVELAARHRGRIHAWARTELGLAPAEEELVPPAIPSMASGDSRAGAAHRHGTSPCRGRRHVGCDVGARGPVRDVSHVGQIPGGASAGNGGPRTPLIARYQPDPRPTFSEWTTCNAGGVQGSLGPSHPQD
jgi:hypothetical protein